MSTAKIWTLSFFGQKNFKRKLYADTSLWQIVHAQFVRKHRPCEQVGDLQSKGCPVPVFFFYDVSNLEDKWSKR